MATVRKITRDDHTVMPWKNGGGMTRQIATGGGTGDDWGWRVSMATVERDGAYSEFPGVDRTTTVIIGNGSDLFHPDGTTIALNPLQPTLIPSNVAVWGILRDDPIVNLNVMTRQGRFAAEVSVVTGPCSHTVPAGEDQVLLVQGLAGQCSAAIDGADPTRVEEEGTLLIEGCANVALSLHDGARVAVILVSSAG